VAVAGGFKGDLHLFVLVHQAAEGVQGMGKAEVIQRLGMQALGDEPQMLNDGVCKVFGFFEAFSFSIAGFEVLRQLAEVQFQYGQLGAYFIVQVFSNALAFLFLALENGNEALPLEFEVFIAEGKFVLDYLFLLKDYEHYDKYAQYEHTNSTNNYHFKNVHARSFFAFMRPI
jgi:hypothetical protein